MSSPLDLPAYAKDFLPVGYKQQDGVDIIRDYSHQVNFVLLGNHLKETDGLYVLSHYYHCIDDMGDTIEFTSERLCCSSFLHFLEKAIESSEDQHYRGCHAEYMMRGIHYSAGHNYVKLLGRGPYKKANMTLFLKEFAEEIANDSLMGIPSLSAPDPITVFILQRVFFIDSTNTIFLK